jgi:hypothetical protein
MWRCEDVKMWGCEDVKMWIWENVTMWCEDEKMWRWEDVKMWWCEDVKMRRCEDVRMWRCEDFKMRRCEDLKMWCEDVEMWRCENVWQTPTIRRTTLRSDALGKKPAMKGAMKSEETDLRHDETRTIFGIQFFTRCFDRSAREMCGDNRQRSVRETNHDLPTWQTAAPGNADSGWLIVCFKVPTCTRW